MKNIKYFNILIEEKMQKQNTWNNLSLCSAIMCSAQGCRISPKRAACYVLVSCDVMSPCCFFNDSTSGSFVLMKCSCETNSSQTFTFVVQCFVSPGKNTR